MIESTSFRELLSDCAMAVDQKSSYGSALAMERSTMGIKLDSKTCSIEERTWGSGAVFRALNGHTVEELATNDLNSGPLKTEVMEFLKHLTPCREKLELSHPPAGASDFVTPVMIDPASISLDEKLETFSELKDVLLQLDNHVRDA